MRRQHDDAHLSLFIFWRREVKCLPFLFWCRSQVVCLISLALSCIDSASIQKYLRSSHCALPAGANSPRGVRGRSCDGVPQHDRARRCSSCARAGDESGGEVRKNGASLRLPQPIALALNYGFVRDRSGSRFVSAPHCNPAHSRDQLAQYHPHRTIPAAAARTRTLNLRKSRISFGKKGHRVSPGLRAATRFVNVNSPEEIWWPFAPIRNYRKLPTTLAAAECFDKLGRCVRGR